MVYDRDVQNLFSFSCALREGKGYIYMYNSEIKLRSLEFCLTQQKIFHRTFDIIQNISFNCNCVARLPGMVFLTLYFPEGEGWGIQAGIWTMGYERQHYYRPQIFKCSFLVFHFYSFLPCPQPSNHHSMLTMWWQDWQAVPERCSTWAKGPADGEQQHILMHVQRVMIPC